MRHSTNEAINLFNLCKIDARTLRPINHIEASGLARVFTNDSPAVAQAAFASLVDAILAVSGRRFTWATVKLYYFVFYAIRSLLLIGGTHVFYVNSRPYSILAKSGAVFHRRSGTSHGITFSEFRSSYSADALISQPIGIYNDPLEWMENLRNAASYSTAPFPDPQPPDCFIPQQQRLRRWISDYFAEGTPIYPFQQEHAVIAYPIFAIRRLSAELERIGKVVEVDPHYLQILINAGCDVGALRHLPSFRFTE
jgi:hypothetical protein